jgi:ATP-dependent protease Clp ATPase subunit
LFAGAWSSLREDAPKSVIGFQDQSHPDPLTLVNSTVSLAIKDLGMPLELVGRMSQSVHLTPLSQEALIAILTTESISPLCGLHDYLATKGSRIIIQDELLQKIAHTALKQGTGARGLVPLVRFYTDQIYWEKEIDNKVFYLTADGSLQVTSVSMSNSPSTFPEVA